jgi:predicted Zn-dependent peptidase
MGTILGQGMSSRLFKIMRDERGMCYYVRATPATYTDAGYFSVSAGVNKQRLEEALEVILEQMKKLTTDLVQAKELVKAKEFIIGTKALGLESSSDLAEWFGFQELHHDALVDITHFNAEIQKVTAEDIQNVARDIFTDERLNLAVVGPFKNDKTLRKILSFT